MFDMQYINMKLVRASYYISSLITMSDSFRKSLKLRNHNKEHANEKRTNQLSLLVIDAGLSLTKLPPDIDRYDACVNKIVQDEIWFCFSHDEIVRNDC